MLPTPLRRPWLGFALTVLVGFVIPFAAPGKDDAATGDVIQGQQSDRFAWAAELNSGWTFEPDADAAETNRVAIPAIVPAAWESFLATDFDGSGTYRRVFSAEESSVIDSLWAAANETTRHHLQLHFDGVATQAELFCNGQPVGSHLGGWTPWARDLDQAWNSGGPNEISVRVDEKVGHHTQGFLPVFAPHFGGIWQPVRLQIVPSRRIIAGESLVLGKYDSDGNHAIEVDLRLSKEVQSGNQLRITIEQPRRWIRYQANEDGSDLEPIWQVANHAGVNESVLTISDQHCRVGRVTKVIPMTDALPWSPEHPWLYAVNIELMETPVAGRDAKVLHHTSFRTGVRTATTDQHQIRLNDDTIILRGVLNWGYAPPSTAPSLDPNFFLSELQTARQAGFNLMKFCLWIPPKRYLEMADEMGVLTWIEYPTWHADLTEANREDLQREYKEFTDYDRNHPSVILRSLTCETGPSAELSVIQALYDLVHRQVPGAIVEDDSSWISWNRVSDIWDDHPYGNNHTWTATLARLRDFIAQREAKPLVLGEAIAADTWPDLKSLASQVRQAQALTNNANRPFWLFGFFEAAEQFEQSLRHFDAECNAGVRRTAADRLGPDSIHYAQQMRKFQIETFRREIPWGGYVVSVLRDFPLASMGLIDSRGDFKFPEWSIDGDWSVSEPMLILRSPDDRRSFWSEETTEVTFLLASAEDLGPENPGTGCSQLSWRCVDARGNVRASGEREFPLKRGASDPPTSDVHYQVDTPIAMPQLAKVSQLGRAESMTLHAVVCVNRGVETITVQGQWPIWLLPSSAEKTTPIAIAADDSLSPRNRAWFDTLVSQQLAVWGDLQTPDSNVEVDQKTIVLASRLDRRLMNRIDAGASVLMMPDGGKGSFPLESHWFLRGGPVVFAHPMLGASSGEIETHQDMLVELQHFDLASDVHSSFDFWQQAAPVLMLWDTHDIKQVKTHGLVWEAGLGRGRLLLTALDHDPTRSAAGPYLLTRMLQYLHASDEPPTTLNVSMLDRISDALDGRELDLSVADWKLMPDHRQVGFDEGWQDPAVSTHHWQPVKITSHWEGQGYENLDGWAWYSTEVSIPQDWPETTYHLCFTGVDDHYQAFVNGTAVGEAGDIATKTTAFEMRTSHALPVSLIPGDRLSIRIAVYDWYGAGGIFRPVYLRTSPLAAGNRILNP